MLKVQLEHETILTRWEAIRRDNNSCAVRCDHIAEGVIKRFDTYIKYTVVAKFVTPLTYSNILLIYI